MLVQHPRLFTFPLVRLCLRRLFSVLPSVCQAGTVGGGAPLRSSSLLFAQGVGRRDGSSALTAGAGVLHATSIFSSFLQMIKARRRVI